MTAGAAAAGSGVCHNCGQPVGATDSFCESCGAELAPPSVSDGSGGGPPVCEACSSPRISADGFCESCGQGCTSACRADAALSRARDRALPFTALR